MPEVRVVIVCDLDVDGRKFGVQMLRIPGVYIHGRKPSVRQCFAVIPSPISSRTRTKFKYK